MTITTTEYGSFEEAFNCFNRELFNHKLPPCLITLQRKKGALGYYSPHRFKSRVNQAHTDEIALNPALFNGQTDEDILSTLVHEMVHQYQRLYGNPGRGRYHNREWADLMIERGLMPSSNGSPGGKLTGDRMSHYIIKGGRFQKACQKLLATGFKLQWQSDDGWRLLRGNNGTATPAPKFRKDREKFTCPQGRQNAWAKSSAVLICGVCYQVNPKVQIMRAFWDVDFADWSDEALAGLSLAASG